MNRNKFIHGSVLMVIVNFVVQAINFTYNVMLSKFLGAEAMGLFQMIMSILMIFLIFSIFGIPTAVSKLVAEQNSKRNHYAIKNILGVALSLTLLISVFLSFIILLFGETISFKMFKNDDMLISIYLLIPAIFLISTTAILSSYYYGLRMIIIPSVSQIIEHLARFIIVLGFLYYVYPVDPLYGALIAILGVIIGETFHLVWLIFMFNRSNKKSVADSPNRPYHIAILKQILPIATPIGISGLLNVLLRLLNSIWIPQKLIEAGYTYNEAIGVFGRITGMTMPLIMLTFMVTSAMVTNLVPNLSEQMALKNYKNINNNILFSIKITLLISIPLAGVCIFFSEPLGIFLYRDYDVGRFIHIMSYGTISLALQHIFSGILHGLNKQITVTMNRLLGMAIQLLAIYYLVGNPRFGINGFFIGFLSSGIVICILDIIAIQSIVPLKLEYVDLILKPLIATIFMVAVISFSMKHLYIKDSLNFILSILIGGFSYVFILHTTRAIPKNLFNRLIR